MTPANQGESAVNRLRALALLLIFAPLVVACGESGNGGASQTGSAANAPGDPPATLKRAFAKLAHTPSGAATLTWTPGDHTLAIALDLYGFAPNSIHPVQIRSGRCESGGPNRYDLGKLTADGQGRIAKTLTQPGVNDGVPTHDWYLAVQNAVGDDPFAQLALACVNLSNADSNTSHQQVIRASVKSGVGPSMNVTGEATLEIEDGVLVVVVTLAGLEPFSEHPLYIKVGDCAHVGPSAFSFYPAQADSTGRAKIKQSFDGVVTIPSSSWSLVVLRGVHLESQIDAAPISCGNITPAP
jgi:hypothetical protein